MGDPELWLDEIDFTSRSDMKSRDEIEVSSQAYAVGSRCEPFEEQKALAA